MMQQFTNMVYTLMLAKFMLNDMPHAFNVTGATYPWVPAAWSKLNSYAISHDIKFFSPEEAYRSTIEHRMPVDDITRQPLSDGVRSFMQVYEQLLSRKLPNVKLPPDDAVRSIRAFMSGYHMIATGEASDVVVNDTYNLIKDRFLEFAKDYDEGGEETEFEEMMGTTQWYEDLDTASGLFVNGSRADKVIAIDAVTHLLHEYEPRSIIEDMFVSGAAEVTFTPMGVALGQMYDIWFGTDPRRGIRLAEYIEGR